MVANLREERQWAKRAMRGTTEQGDFVARFQSLSTNLPASLADLETDAKNHLAEVNSLLGRTDFKTIDAAFEQWRKTSRKKYDPEWYKVLGKRSLRQITEEVGRVPDYEIFYSRGSDVTHSGLYKDHIKFVREGFRFKLIRHVSDYTICCHVSWGLQYIPLDALSAHIARVRNLLCPRSTLRIGVRLICR